MNQKVAVIGTGRMGSALATALFKKGFATTVWNRTAAKTEPLSRLGVRVAQSVLEAVRPADVIIVNINNYDSTKKLVRKPEIESALRGKILIQLSSGTPDEAREMESWARPHGINYLDGAIWSAPEWIGTAECTAVLFSGSEELFTRVKPVLLALSENTQFVGNEIGQASALDTAVLAGFAMNAMFGFLQGYIICEAENIPVETYMQIVKRVGASLKGVARMFAKLQQKDYHGDQASLEAWSIGPKMLIDWSRKHGVDHSIADAQLSLMNKAIEAGKSQADFAYLYEVLKKSSA
jgi:3-hydroxyisobutyrate dehydrogenase-like beta-hydroxyacid dehydrogenase